MLRLYLALVFCGGPSVSAILYSWNADKVAYRGVMRAFRSRASKPLLNRDRFAGVPSIGTVVSRVFQAKPVVLEARVATRRYLIWDKLLRLWWYFSNSFSHVNNSRKKGRRRRRRALLCLRPHKKFSTEILRGCIDHVLQKLLFAKQFVRLKSSSISRGLARNYLSVGLQDWKGLIATWKTVHTAYGQQRVARKIGKSFYRFWEDPLARFFIEVLRETMSWKTPGANWRHQQARKGWDIA